MNKDNLEKSKQKDWKKDIPQDDEELEDYVGDKIEQIIDAIPKDDNHSLQFDVKKEGKSLSKLPSGVTNHPEETYDYERRGSGQGDNQHPVDTNKKPEKGAVTNRVSGDLEKSQDDNHSQKSQSGSKTTDKGKFLEKEMFFSSSDSDNSQETNSNQYTGMTTQNCSELSLDTYDKTNLEKSNHNSAPLKSLELGEVANADEAKPNHTDLEKFKQDILKGLADKVESIIRKNHRNGHLICYKDLKDDILEFGEKAISLANARCLGEELKWLKQHTFFKFVNERIKQIEGKISGAKHE